jgi:hypothetical protein
VKLVNGFRPEPMKKRTPDRDSSKIRRYLAAGKAQTPCPPWRHALQNFHVIAARQARLIAANKAGGGAEPLLPETKV